VAARAVAESEEGAQAAEILSWAYVCVFAFVVSVGRAFYSSQALEPTLQFDLLYRLGMLVFVWNWITTQVRRHRAALPLDVGLFVFALGPFVGPLLLWRRQRWRGVLKTAVLIAIFAVAHVFSLALHYALVGLQ
jgi:hypothetical protein